MQTTLRKIQAHGPCDRGWNAILNYVGKKQPDDDPVSFVTLVDAVGLLGAIWCLRTIDGHEAEKAEFQAFCESGPRTQEEMTIEFLLLFGD